MPLFKRKDKTTIAELEEYYTNNDKTRSGKAWFMAFLSLLITIMVLAALFFIGRWAFQTLTGNNSDEDVSVAAGADKQGSDSDLPSYDTDEFGDVGVDFGEDEARSEGVVSDEAASTTRNPDGSEQSSSDVAGADTSTEEYTDTETSDSIPDTGAGELLIVAPAVAAVAGYAVSRKRQLTK